MVSQIAPSHRFSSSPLRGTQWVCSVKPELIFVSARTNKGHHHLSRVGYFRCNPICTFAQSYTKTLGLALWITRKNQTKAVSVKSDDATALLAAALF